VKRSRSPRPSDTFRATAWCEGSSAVSVGILATASALLWFGVLVCPTNTHLSRVIFYGHILLSLATLYLVIHWVLAFRRRDQEARDELVAFLAEPSPSMLNGAARAAQLRRHLGARIRALRDARKLTQEVIADRIGVVPKYVSQLECGQRSPSWETMIAIAHHAFEIKVAALMSGIDEDIASPEEAEQRLIVRMKKASRGAATAHHDARQHGRDGTRKRQRPPLHLLNVIVKGLWSAKTYERVFKPVIADIHHEWADARRRQERFRSWWIRNVRGRYAVLGVARHQLPWSAWSAIKRLVRLMFTFGK
jgi:transcriptional regulator with XRE-family HTH domain